MNWIEKFNSLTVYQLMFFLHKMHLWIIFALLTVTPSYCILQYTYYQVSIMGIACVDL